MFNIGDYFRINDTMLVADRPMLDSLIAGGHDLSKVCVSHITDLSFAFDNQAILNQDIGNWDEYRYYQNKMFLRRKTLTKTLVIGMSLPYLICQECSSGQEFNQDLSQWCVGSIYSSPISFSEYAPLFVEYAPHWGLCSQLLWITTVV